MLPAHVRFDKVLKNIPIKGVYEFLIKNPKLWLLNTQRQDYEGSAHIDTECIYIKGPKEFTKESYQEDIGSYTYPIPDALWSLIGALMYPVWGKYGTSFEIGYAMFVSLPPGGKVLEHVDEGKYADHYQRFHIPIYSKPGNVFTCGGESVIMREGELWTFNHRLPHSVVNNSEDERIHFIFDAVI